MTRWQNTVDAFVLGVIGFLSCSQISHAVSLVVTSPIGATVWHAGTTRQISWLSTDVVGNVFIDLYQGGVFQQFLAYVPVNDNTYPWSICEYIGDADDYTVVITGFTLDEEPVYGVSDGFSIIDSLPAPPTPTITLTSPNGGEVWQAGTSQAITWTATDPLGHVLIQLDKDGVFHSYLGYAAMAEGHLSWDICQYIGDATTYTISLWATNACGQPIGDVSDYPFAIDGSLPSPPAPTLALTSPNGGENWVAGSSHTITWSTTNPLGDVTIDLYQGDSFVGTLGTVPMAAGSFTWDICPSSGDGSDYVILITGADSCGQSVLDRNDGFFAISGSQPTPLLTVISPSGEETWSAYSDQTVTWSATGPSGICYVYLLGYTGGVLQEVQLIGSTPMSTGQLSWSIDQCQGRLVDGSYQILIAYGCVQNLQQALSGAFDIMPVGIFGDLNDDCDVDASDVDILASCAAGPAVPHNGSTQCQISDIDFDEDVDADDFAILQRCLGTAEIPVDPTCVQ